MTLEITILNFTMAERQKVDKECSNLIRKAKNTKSILNSDLFRYSYLK